LALKRERVSILLRVIVLIVGRVRQVEVLVFEEEDGWENEEFGTGYEFDSGVGGTDE
jgi:hypothetical protein